MWSTGFEFAPVAPNLNIVVSMPSAKFVAYDEIKGSGSVIPTVRTRTRSQTKTSNSLAIQRAPLKSVINSESKQVFMIPLSPEICPIRYTFPT